MLLIFRKTSYINGKLFPPWLDIDLKERFAYPDYFRYELNLSKKGIIIKESGLSFYKFHNFQKTLSRFQKIKNKTRQCCLLKCSCFTTGINNTIIITTLGVTTKYFELSFGMLLITLQ